jgi:NAD(P)-dependent dehydrogenase (short-subunit alcohol dehydrogenase family)
MGGEHVIVTGGTTGSGRAIVRLLSENKCSVSLLGRHRSPEVEEDLPGLRFYLADLSDVQGTRVALEQCLAERGKVTHLVFYQRYRGLGNEWHGELQVSLTATKEIIELCADRFDGAGSNAIVVISSVASHFIHEEQGIGYHVAKAAVNQMVRYLAVALGPRGIRVNCVSPATLVKEESREFYCSHAELRELYDSVIPLRRMGTSEDVAKVVEFLCSASASFITGQEIVVDGGLSLVGHASLARRLARLDGLKVTRSGSMATEVELSGGRL